MTAPTQEPQEPQNVAQEPQNVEEAVDQVIEDERRREFIARVDNLLDRIDSYLRFVRKSKGEPVASGAPANGKTNGNEQAA
jgi:hypothetical protein